MILWYAACGASGALYTLICCVIGCGCLYSCFYRSKMRQQQNLKGNNCLDCLIHCCCEPCALSQEYRQLENQGFNMVIGTNHIWTIYLAFAWSLFFFICLFVFVLKLFFLRLSLWLAGLPGHVSRISTGFSAINF